METLSFPELGVIGIALAAVLVAMRIIERLISAKIAKAGGAERRAVVDIPPDIRQAVMSTHGLVRETRGWLAPGDDGIQVWKGAHIVSELQRTNDKLDTMVEEEKEAVLLLRQIERGLNGSK